RRPGLRPYHRRDECNNKHQHAQAKWRVEEEKKKAYSVHRSLPCATSIRHSFEKTYRSHKPGPGSFYLVIVCGTLSKKLAPLSIFCPNTLSQSICGTISPIAFPAPISGASIATSLASASARCASVTAPATSALWANMADETSGGSSTPSNACIA